MHCTGVRICVCYLVWGVCVCFQRSRNTTHTHTHKHTHTNTRSTATIHKYLWHFDELREMRRGCVSDPHNTVAGGTERYWSYSVKGKIYRSTLCKGGWKVAGWKVGNTIGIGAWQYFWIFYSLYHTSKTKPFKQRQEGILHPILLKPIFNALWGVGHRLRFVGFFFGEK